MENNEFNQCVTLATDNLNIKQRQAAEQLALGKTQEEAGYVAGVTRQTINKWAKDPEFQNCVKLFERRLEVERHENLMAEFNKMESDAVKVLQELLMSDSDNVKLKAAVAILNAKKQYDEKDNAKDNIDVVFSGMPVPSMPVHEIHNGGDT